MITFDKEKKYFHLSNDEISYIFQIEEHGYLAHIYFGAKVNHYSGNFTYPRIDRSFSPNPQTHPDRLFSVDTLLLEYPTFGNGDFRESALEMKYSDGSKVTNLKFKEYKILASKNKLTGMPHARLSSEDSETLEITLIEPFRDIEVTLIYTIVKNLPLLTKSVRIKNNSKEHVELLNVASGGLEFPQQAFELVHLSGSWAHERMIVREEISKGSKHLGSKRGSSSHFEQPFYALVSKDTNEFYGDAYGAYLIYSGDHQSVIQKDAYNQYRSLIGINPANFHWNLNPEEIFETPEMVVNYSNQGLNKLSQSMHQFINKHIVRPEYQGIERPVLINNWEATYFDFDEQKLKRLIDVSANLGIELFVLDDGWFGERNDDTTSLGDWFVNDKKLINGLKTIANYTHDKEMKFGLWFEPEMISKNSLLYKDHPEWVLGDPKSTYSVSRSQWVLDFSNPEVIENIYNQMKSILSSVKIDYIKWDMNRNISEVFSSAHTSDLQGTVLHRYILGVYELIDRLTNEFPQILFEGCSGGGGRFDMGMLFYMPQFWTSDNTDAVDRVDIQYGTSLIYPTSTMGAHISAVPNHQTGRITSMDTRAKIAMTGVFGLELDVTKMSIAELADIKQVIEFYKANRVLFQFGTFIRLLSPFESNDSAWMMINDEQSEGMSFIFHRQTHASYPKQVVKFKGLDPQMKYCINDTSICYGDELMSIGLYVDYDIPGDYQVKTYHFIALNN